MQKVRVIRTPSCPLSLSTDLHIACQLKLHKKGCVDNYSDCPCQVNDRKQQRDTEILRMVKTKQVEKISLDMLGD